MEKETRQLGAFTRERRRDYEIFRIGIIKDAQPSSALPRLRQGEFNHVRICAQHSDRHRLIEMADSLVSGFASRSKFDMQIPKLSIPEVPLVG